MVDPLGSDERTALLFADRKRTNLVKIAEQRLLIRLVKHVPAFVSPNGMTAIGLLGSTLVLIGFWLAAVSYDSYLGLGILGLFINWLGDSLDGRLAYFRRIPRKWYGFALDIIADWISIVLIGVGFYSYAPIQINWIGFTFVFLYGWSMLIALLKYKITDRYEIDSGLVGPTELRLVIAIILLTEILYAGSIVYLAAGITTVLLFVNIKGTIQLLKEADIQDRIKTHDARSS